MKTNKKDFLNPNHWYSTTVADIVATKVSTFIYLFIFLINYYSMEIQFWITMNTVKLELC